MTPSFNNYQHMANLVPPMIMKIVKCSQKHATQIHLYLTLQVHSMHPHAGKRHKARRAGALA